MNKTNPEITKNFVKDSLEKAVKGIYQVNVKIGEKNIPIDVFPEVFPPKSDYSASSRSVYKTFGDLTGMTVADIGCGTGIESIVAIIAGATCVDATDISKVAFECTKQNVLQNNLNDKINVYRGDLFSALPNKKYDLIIANLPIVDFKPETESDITRALYDESFSLHKRMLAEAKNYLSKKGIITFTHANLQSGKTEVPDEDFVLLEKLIIEHGYEIVERKETLSLGYKWINYKICPRVRSIIYVKGSDGRGYFLKPRS